MRDWFVRWFVAALALGAVAWILPGIRVGHGPTGLATLLVGAALLGIANAVVKPILIILSCPLIILTLGLFLFLINAAVLLLASALSRGLGFPFQVDGWGSAVLGSILLTVVHWIFSAFIQNEDENRERNT